MNKDVQRLQQLAGILKEGVINTEEKHINSQGRNINRFKPKGKSSNKPKELEKTATVDNQFEKDIEEDIEEDLKTLGAIIGYDEIYQAINDIVPEPGDLLDTEELKDALRKLVDLDYLNYPEESLDLWVIENTRTIGNITSHVVEDQGGEVKNEIFGFSKKEKEEKEAKRKEAHAKSVEKYMKPLSGAEVIARGKARGEVRDTDPKPNPNSGKVMSKRDMIKWRTIYLNNIQSISPLDSRHDRNVQMTDWATNVENLVKGYDNEDEAYEYILTGR